MLLDGVTYAATSGRIAARRLFASRGCPTLRLRSDSHSRLEQAGGSEQSWPAGVARVVLTVRLQ